MDRLFIYLRGADVFDFAVNSFIIIFYHRQTIATRTS